MLEVVELRVPEDVIDAAPRRDRALASLLPPDRRDLQELLARFDDVRDRDLRGRDHRFVVEGERVVRRFLRGPFRCESLLTTRDALARIQVLAEAHLRATGSPRLVAFVGSDPLLASISGYRLHGGCLAMGIRSWWPPPSSALVARWAERPADEPLRCVIAEGVVQVENIAALFRSGAAFGVDGILLDERCADPLLRKTIRFSMGRVFDVAWGSSRDLMMDLRALRAGGFSVVGVELTDRSLPLRELRPGRRTALVVGAEGNGLSDEVLAECETVVRIPARPADEDGEARSLNVGVAASIALYELFR